VREGKNKTRDQDFSDGYLVMMNFGNEGVSVSRDIDGH
jgi:hypothetical protein